MSRCLRTDVAKRQAEFVFVDDIRRYLAVDDFLEDRQISIRLTGISSPDLMRAAGFHVENHTAEATVLSLNLDAVDLRFHNSPGRRCRSADVLIISAAGEYDPGAG